MCEYMLTKNGVPYCEPKKELCSMCVLGNSKTYKQIKEEGEAGVQKTRNRD